MLSIYRRHLATCLAENPKRGRSYWRCDCPIWVQGTLGGQKVRQSLDVTSREAASRLVNEWNATGVVGCVKQEPTRIDDAVRLFLEAKRKKFLAEATLKKLRTIFEKQLLAWANDRGYRYLHELTPARLESWRSTWKDASLAASKKYQRAVGFFHFCTRMKWITDNPMKALDPPKVRQVPTLPFTAEEMTAILAACDRVSIKGIYGEGNRPRVRAMTLLLRYSGLRIRDAATLGRDRIVNGKLLLYMQKTGMPVFVPLPPFVLDALNRVPPPSTAYFFWTGEGMPESTVGHWQYTLGRLFKLAGIDGGHAHRFRDTFAVELLLAGIPLDQVSILLGHSSVKITEKSYAPWVKARQEQLEAAVVKTWGLIETCCSERAPAIGGNPHRSSSSSGLPSESIVVVG